MKRNCYANDESCTCCEQCRGARGSLFRDESRAHYRYDDDKLYYDRNRSNTDVCPFYNNGQCCAKSIHSERIIFCGNPYKQSSCSRYHTAIHGGYL